MSSMRQHRPFDAPRSDSAYAERQRSLAALVGNTPLLAVDLGFGGESRTVYAKLETSNLTGSVKDRAVLHCLRAAAADGVLAPGALLVAAGSGNAAVSCAALGRALEHPVAIFVGEGARARRIDRLRLLGADVHVVPATTGDPSAAARALADETEGAFQPLEVAAARQARAHELSTGPELWWQLAPLGLAPDALVAGVGSGATLAGTGRYLRDNDRSVSLFPVEPAHAPLQLDGAGRRAHRIVGIAERGEAMARADASQFGAPIAIDDGDAIIMTQRLASEFGLEVGISSGANLLGSIVAQERLGRDAVVATVFCDTNAAYRETTLARAEPSRHEFVSRHVVLRGFRVIPPLPLQEPIGSGAFTVGGGSRSASSEGPPGR